MFNYVNYVNNIMTQSAAGDSELSSIYKLPRATCPYCGHNPSPHFFTWYVESLDILLAPLRRLIFYNPASRLVRRWLKSRQFGWRFASLLLKLRVFQKQSDISVCKVRRAQVLWEEAQKRGIKFFGLKLFGKNLDMYLAEKSGKRLFIDGLPRPQNSDGGMLDVMDDKLLLKNKLAAAGLPVPAGGSATGMPSAVKIFRLIDKPVIVKPRTGSRGRHTTTFVRTEEDLRQAVKVAKQLCHWVMVEEQLFGPVYRATIIDGPSTSPLRPRAQGREVGTSKLAGVLRGDPPQVTGDGKHTIAQLINIKNSQPHPRVKDIVMDSSAELFLQRQQLFADTILPAGQIVPISEKIGLNSGGSSSEDFDICHPDNAELFLRAAEVLGDPLVGFDFIIPDIAKSWKSQKCGFIEANSLPFINLHHDPLKGAPRNAAALVWEMMGM